jgi:hypothetical protein
MSEKLRLIEGKGFMAGYTVASPRTKQLDMLWDQETVQPAFLQEGFRLSHPI